MKFSEFGMPDVTGSAEGRKKEQDATARKDKNPTILSDQGNRIKHVLEDISWFLIKIAMLFIAKPMS